MAARALSQCGRTGDWMVCAGLMEKIMSNHTSYSAAAMSEQTRELKANELDQIAGGTPSIPIPPPAPNVTVNGGPLAFVASLVARS